MDKTKIFLFSKETKAGLSTFLNNLSRLTSRNFNLSLFLFKKEFFFPSRLNIKVRYIDQSHGQKTNSPLPKLLKFLSDMVKTFFIISTKKPDIICCNDTYSILTVLPLSFIFSGIPTVVIVHSDVLRALGNGFGSKTKSILLRYYSILIRRAGKIIFVSGGTRSDYIKRFKINPKKTLIIYYGIKLPRPKIRPDNSSDDHTWTIISTGRFERQKDFKTVIKAIHVLSEKHKVKLNLIGKGGFEASYVNLAKDLDIENLVNFMGWKTRAQIYQALKRADIFVFSSFYETFGIAVIEALACGLPVVATNTKHGPKEALGGGKFGIIVPVGDHKKMAGAIERLIRDKNLREEFSRVGYRRSKDFDVRVMVDNYERLFNSLSQN